MNVNHDDRPPGAFRGKGYWVDQAWYSYLNERRIEAMARRRDEELKYRTATPHWPKRHYTSDDICPCGKAQQVVAGKCRRCYQREYMRDYYARKNVEQRRHPFQLAVS